MTLQRIVLLGLALTFAQNIFAVAADALDEHVVTRRLLDATSNAKSVMGLAKSCYSAFIANQPPSFCYKKGADFGTIPTACSPGYFRSLALCYADCSSGYYFVAGVCWESCGSGYSDDGLTCYRNLFNWYFKSSYIPSSYTNFDSRAACSPGMYKSGALCYRDCSKIGLLNCGIGACAATTAACASTIATMAVDALLAIGQTVTLILTMGGSSEDGEAVTEAKASIEAGFSKLGPTTIKESVNIFKTVLEREGSEAFIEEMTEYVLKKGAVFAGKEVAKEVVSKVCTEIGNKLLHKVSQSDGSSLNFQSFKDNLEKQYLGTCTDATTTNNQISCAATVLNDIAIVDPTGFAALAASVLQPICNGV